MLHPITFSIPKEKLCTTQNSNTKTKILSSLIPGDTSTYIYNTEEDYYNEYKTSYFAITQKKEGWDCLRHYEILANGCIPYFINIENCPENTMFFFPKELINKTNQLYNKFQNKNINDLTEEEIKEYYFYQNELFEYTKNNLTTDKIAKYILEKTNFQNKTKILFLSGDLKPDYLRCLTLNGFKNLIGSSCHDFPKVPHIYKTNINNDYLYGKGFTYSNLLDPLLHNENLDYSLIDDIKNKYYDIIIYGSYHRGMPYFELIKSLYKPNEIILLCGEDLHCCNYNYYLNMGHNVFVREL